jgi:hypothetical protein
MPWWLRCPKKKADILTLKGSFGVQLYHETPQLHYSIIEIGSHFQSTTKAVTDLRPSGFDLRGGKAHISIVSLFESLKLKFSPILGYPMSSNVIGYSPQERQTWQTRLEFLVSNERTVMTSMVLV